MVLIILLCFLHQISGQKKRKDATVSEYFILLFCFSRIRLIAMNKKGHQALSTCGETNKQMRPFCFSSSADELKRAETHSRV